MCVFISTNMTPGDLIDPYHGLANSPGGGEAHPASGDAPGSCEAPDPNTLWA